MSYILLAEEYNISREYIYEWNISEYDDVEYAYNWSIAELLDIEYTYNWSIAELVSATYTYEWSIANYVIRIYRYVWNIGTRFLGGKVKYRFRMSAVKNRFYRSFRDK